MQNLKIKDMAAAKLCATGKQPVGMLSITQKNVL